MFILTRRKSISRLAKSASLPIALFSYVILIAIQSQLVACSPPLDYFVYTSQLATAQPGAQIVSSILPSLKSIYSPEYNLNQNQNQNLNNNVNLEANDIVNKVLNLIKNSSHTHDNDMIDLESVRYAWHLMERQALIYTKNRVITLKPFIAEILRESQVSNQCEKAINDWLDKLTELKQWATLMWNSWGDFPPAGLFEGSFTDLGSYRGCLKVGQNDIIGQAQYCTLDFQPLVPTRPRYHSIFKRILDVDSNFGQLVGGDFPVDKISSKHSAHGFSSLRFQPNKMLLNQSENALALNRYNKRTIIHNGTEESTTSQEFNFNTNLTLKAEVSFRSFFFILKFNYYL